MEDGAGYDEDTENDDLEGETNDNNSFSSVLATLLSHQSSSYPRVSDVRHWRGEIFVCLPPDWTRKENTSPKTKIFVSQVLRMGDRLSAWVKAIMRPRIIYILAAKSAGATRRSKVCMM